MRKINLLYLAGLLGYVALIGSVLSVASEIHFILLMIFAIAILSGLILDRRTTQEPLIDNLYLFGITVFGIIISLILLSEKNIFNRALSILVIITSAKLITPKTGRDILQIYLLNFFMVTGSAITRLDLEFGFLILGETFITILGLLLVYGSNEQKELPVFNVLRLARLSGVITVCLIPATIIIFIIIPRPSMGLFAWGQGIVSQTGFSDRVTPGAVEEIKVNESPAFRAKWISGKRPERIMWRGIIYDKYNYGAWERSFQEEVSSIPEIAGNSVEYEIILEPTDTRYLLGMGVPLLVTGNRLRTRIVSGFTIESDRIINNRIIYRVKSLIPDNIPADRAPEYFLGVPSALREELRPYITDLRRNSDMDSARAVDRYLKSNFSYDLQPGEPSDDPILYFLKDSGKGHCEYFASTMTLLLRSMNIPARMVGGYLGGEWNEMGQYYLVRQSNAHTWVEVWIKGEGWVTFDPTPPNPIASSRGQFYRFMDMLRVKWYYWVIDYNINRQLELFQKGSAFLKSFKGKDLDLNLKTKIPPVKYLLLFIAFLFCVFLIFMVLRYYRDRPRTYGERFVSLMKRHGYYKAPGETFPELVFRIKPENPRLQNSAMSFISEYYRIEFGQKGSNENLTNLFETLKGELNSAH